jgi:hypothetical protein
LALELEELLYAHGLQSLLFAPWMFLGGEETYGSMQEL